MLVHNGFLQALPHALLLSPLVADKVAAEKRITNSSRSINPTAARGILVVTQEAWISAVLRIGNGRCQEHECSKNDKKTFVHFND